MDAMIEYSLYELHAIRPLSPIATKLKRPGALLRVNGGVGCLQPFPELGDEPLKAQLEKLADGVKTPGVDRALKCAAIDGEARRQGKSLFDGLEIPKSHYLLTDFLRFSQEEFRNVVSDCKNGGFSCIKIKGGRDLDAEIRQIEKLAWSCDGTDIKLRIDFNDQLTQQTYEAFLSKISSNVLSRVDYIEDPYPYEASQWSASRKVKNVALAKDSNVGLVTEGFDAFIIKPAVQDPAPYVFGAAINKKRLVFTSYMDHPIGQYYAAYEAALASKNHPQLVDTCGLMTHNLFQTNTFFEMLRSEGSRLLAPVGTGLGFDGALGSLDWKMLR
ncbi:hypothetical protein GW915_08055 [bacterium]|nr:hypothetical protein [bacterium]